MSRIHTVDTYVGQMTQLLQQMGIRKGKERDGGRDFIDKPKGMLTKSCRRNLIRILFQQILFKKKNYGASGNLYIE